jgi:dTDP-4-amino-4,6-dideoxygalactose transaminase
MREFGAILDRMNLLLGPNTEAFEHEFAAYCGAPQGAAASTVTEEACRELVSIPMYPDLTDEQIDYVAGHVLDFTEHSNGSGAGRRAASA